MNYAALSTAIQDYTQNYETTFVANIPLFVKQTETRVYNTVLIPALRKNVTGATVSGNKYLSCPSDFLSVFSMAAINNGSYEYLLNKDVNFIRESYPTPADTGLPKYYALFGPDTSAINELSFIVGPTPNAAYSVELHYFYYPESITTVSTGQTWLGDNFDIALLNYSLVEAITYMKGEQDMVALYKNRAEGAMALLKQLGDAKEKGDSFRDPPPKYKVI